MRPARSRRSFSILAIRDQVAPPTINLDNPAVETVIDLAPNAKREREINVALSNSFGFGGTNASVIFGKSKLMWRHIASNALTFLILGLFLLGGLVLWGKGQYQAEGPLEQAICLQVERGSNMRRVSETLAGQGAVTSASILRLGADYTNKSGALKAGSYLIEPGLSMGQIVDVVTRGGASTCGTEIVYRIGVTQMRIQIRELDPATSRYEERANFDAAAQPQPDSYAAQRAKPDTRFRIALAEGVTSWQVVQSPGRRWMC